MSGRLPVNEEWSVFIMLVHLREEGQVLDGRHLTTLTQQPDFQVRLHASSKKLNFVEVHLA